MLSLSGQNIPPVPTIRIYLSSALYSVPGGKVSIGHSKEKVYIYMCPIPKGFRDRATSLYSSKTADKKTILRTASNAGIYCSSDKVGTVYQLCEDSIQHIRIFGISEDSRFLDLSTSWRGVVSFTPLPLYPRANSLRYPLDRRLSEPQSRSEKQREMKILDPTGT
jgi:hypothetical protein